VQGGTGTAAAIGRPDGTAGKTGTSEDFGDAWFVGYTPALATSVWMGYSDSRSRPLRNIKGVNPVYGGTIPARTWQAYMSEAEKALPEANFAPPAALAGEFGPGARRGLEQTLVTTPVQIVAGTPPPLPTQTTFPTLPTIPSLTLPPSPFGTTTTVPKPVPTFPTIPFTTTTTIHFP
ncbi:MAG: hypothetical protein LC792_20470, partial [Actinobacteria bacterium]|nr:hypothetical protein [Actinomycetota bacterium]